MISGGNAVSAWHSSSSSKSALAALYGGVKVCIIILRSINSKIIAM